MMDKIKEQIDIEKNDKHSFQKYIDAFTTTDKIKEIYQNDDEFNNLIKKEDKEKEEEDEFF